MKKRSSQNIYGIIFLLTLGTVVFLSYIKSSEANPLEALDKFHTQSPKLEKSVLDSFHSPPAKDTQKAVMSLEQDRKEKGAEDEFGSDMPVIYGSSVPFFLGHSEESSHSVRVLKHKDSYYFNANVKLNHKEYKEFKLLNDYLGGVSILNPVLELGGFYDMFSDEEEINYFFYAGSSFLLGKNYQGVGFKALVYSDSYKDVLESSKGLVSMYYYRSFPKFVMDYDFLTVYAGWVSPPVKVDFSDLEEFKGAFEGLKEFSQNLMIGANYILDPLSPFSFSVEVSLGSASFAVFYALSQDDRLGKEDKLISSHNVLQNSNL